MQGPLTQSRFEIRALLIALFVAIPITGLLAYGLTRNPRAIPSPLIGQPGPTFALHLFNGDVLDTRTLRGKILVVNFWASWCYPACYEEAPRLQRVWDRFKGSCVIVIGVNIQDSEAAARNFIDQFSQTFPNGMDRTGEISIAFGVYGVPETFIVGPGGRIVAKYVGAVPEEWMIDHIQRLPDISTVLSGRLCSS